MSETSYIPEVPADELAHQLVVSLEHADVVLAELAALARTGILTSAPTLPAEDQSVELGLGLIRLSYPSDRDRAAADLPDDVSGRNLNDVLTMVRTACSFRYRGWTPTIGKNRVMNGIGGEGGQSAAAAGQRRRRASQRRRRAGQRRRRAGQRRRRAGQRRRRRAAVPSDGPIRPEARRFGGRRRQDRRARHPARVESGLGSANVRSLDPSSRDHASRTHRYRAIQLRGRPRQLRD